MTIKEFYEQTGADYSGALSRLMNDSMVQRFALKFFNEDPSYGELCEAMAAGDNEAAFRAAHTLKGVALNLALSNIADPACELTEDLRAGGSDRAPELFASVKAEYEKSLAMLGQLG